MIILSVDAGGFMKVNRGTGGIYSESEISRLEWVFGVKVFLLSCAFERVYKVWLVANMHA